MSVSGDERVVYVLPDVFPLKVEDIEIYASVDEMLRCQHAKEVLMAGALALEISEVNRVGVELWLDQLLDFAQTWGGYLLTPLMRTILLEYRSFESPRPIDTELKRRMVADRDSEILGRVAAYMDAHGTEIGMDVLMQLQEKLETLVICVKVDLTPAGMLDLKLKILTEVNAMLADE